MTASPTTDRRDELAEAHQQRGDSSQSDLTGHELHDEAPEPVSTPEPAEHQISILLYSDDFTTRDAVRAAVGRRPAKDVEVTQWFECATPEAVIERADAGGIDVLLLDGEAVPAGGLGLCRQLKNEIFQCPPVLVLTGRAQDAWLAGWAMADLAVPFPGDALGLANAVANLARRS